MILLPVEGIRKALPIGAPPVYVRGLDGITGGKAPDLARQVLDTLLTFTKLDDSVVDRMTGN